MRGLSEVYGAILVFLVLVSGIVAVHYVFSRDVRVAVRMSYMLRDRVVISASFDKGELCVNVSSELPIQSVSVLQPGLERSVQLGGSTRYSGCFAVNPYAATAVAVRTIAGIHFYDPAFDPRYRGCASSMKVFKPAMLEEYARVCREAEGDPLGAAGGVSWALRRVILGAGVGGPSPGDATPDGDEYLPLVYVELSDVSFVLARDRERWWDRVYVYAYYSNGTYKLLGQARIRSSEYPDVYGNWYRDDRAALEESLGGLKLSATFRELYTIENSGSSGKQYDLYTVTYNISVANSSVACYASHYGSNGGTFETNCTLRGYFVVFKTVLSGDFGVSPSALLGRKMLRLYNVTGSRIGFAYRGPRSYLGNLTAEFTVLEFSTPTAPSGPAGGGGGTGLGVNETRSLPTPGAEPVPGRQGES